MQIRKKSEIAFYTPFMLKMEMIVSLTDNSKKIFLIGRKKQTYKYCDISETKKCDWKDLEDTFEPLAGKEHLVKKITFRILGRRVVHQSSGEVFVNRNPYELGKTIREAIQKKAMNELEFSNPFGKFRRLRKRSGISRESIPTR